LASQPLCSSTSATAVSALPAGLIVGAAWTLWHLPFYFMEGTIRQQAGLWSPEFWSDMVTRVPLAVLFAWICLNTGRSILSAVALHALDNVASVIISPEGMQLLVRLALVTGLLWPSRRSGVRQGSRGRRRGDQPEENDAEKRQTDH